jgi:hypothetical protein
LLIFAVRLTCGIAAAFNPFWGLAAGFKGEEEESRVLSEPDPTSGMTELTPNKDGSGRKSDEEKLGEASQLSGT